MQDHVPRPGDRVAVIEGNPAGQWHFDQALGSASVLVVQQQMPHEPGMYMLSDGTIRRASELHLVERPEAVELEHVELDGGRMHTRLAAPKAAA